MAAAQNENKHGKAFLIIVFCFALIIGAGYVIYNNKDFQRSHKREIAKINFYLRDYNTSAKKFSKELNDKIAKWQETRLQKTQEKLAAPKIETRTFEDLITTAEALEKDLPQEMLRHQPDEITICSFDADFLFNSPLSDPEIVHLANILRFCDLSSIAGLTNQDFLRQVTTLLKILRYDAAIDASPLTDNDETITAYLYRNDKVQALTSRKIYSQTNAFPVLPYYASFRIGDFDFTIATFHTPLAGINLSSLEPLEQLYEDLQNENPDIKDTMIFGDFAFHSGSLNWNSASSLLPIIAKSAAANKTQINLLGNFWFKRNQLIEYNGKFGIININENSFPSQKKQPAAANKPIWTQFKIMADDD